MRTSSPSPSPFPFRPRRLLALAVLPALVALGACGGDEDEPAATSSTTSSTAAPDATDAPDGDAQAAWSRNATELRDRVGEQVDHRCPPEGRLGAVWGTNVYTDDSSICSAAVHAGLITVADGGEMTIEIAAGQDEYFGSEANDVESQDFGPYPGSFSFPDAEQAEVAEDIGWDRPANFYKGREQTEFTVVCAPDGEPRSVWGTDVYTDDSSICTAAAHAGAITVEDGGEVTFELVAGQGSYEGSESNGITSNDYGEYGGSFRIVED